MKGVQRGCLVLADIGGYTRYLAGVELEHSTDVLADLLGVVVKQMEGAFRVAKLEGDAVFLFARKGEGSDWEKNRRAIGQKLLRLFESFSRKVRELSAATTCTCKACRS